MQVAQIYHLFTLGDTLPKKAWLSIYLTGTIITAMVLQPYHIAKCHQDKITDSLIL